MQSLSKGLMQFFILGIMLFMIIVGLMFLYYALVYGALIGLVLFAAAWLREKFSSNKIIPATRVEKPKTGRTIEHDDL